MSTKDTWKQRFHNWIYQQNRCQFAGCSNEASVFGSCEECIVKEMVRAKRSEEVREHEKLKAAFKDAMREIETERLNTRNPEPILTK